MLKIVAGASLIACLMPAAVLAGNGVDRRRTPAPTDFRLHATAATAKAAPLVDAPGGQLRTGFGNGQVELYPFGNSGFHLSAGGRLYGRAARPRNADNEQARLLAGPRGTGMRSGRRSSPAALVGIARDVGNGLALGVDGGAALGRLDNAPNRLRLSGREGGSGDGRVNEVGRVTMRYRF